MLAKLSAVMDTKVGQMKRELEEVAHKAHNSQMTELKRIKFSEPPSFLSKGHEQQFKHNEQVKLCIAEAEDAVKDKKYDTCLKKLNEGKEQIEQRHKLILLANKSEYGWKTVSEYIDNELAVDEEDAKKIKKAEKEAQRKLNETCTAKKTRAGGRGSLWPRRGAYNLGGRTWVSLPLAPFPQPSPPSYANTSLYTNMVGRTPGVCFSCGKASHWNRESPLNTVPTVEAQQLSVNILEFECVDDVYLCSDELFEGEREPDQLSYENRTLSREEEFLEGDSIHTRIGGRLRSHISAWEALSPPEDVLRIIQLGYILPLSTLPKPVILKNNKSALDNKAFVTQAISELLAYQSITTGGHTPFSS